MILSPKIDLTENGDFMGGTLFPQALMNMDDEVPFEVFDGEMTTEQYKFVSWWEGLFGVRRHQNRKREIFHNNSRYRSESRIPWEKTCIDGYPYQFHGIPWRRAQIVSVDNERGYNLFNQR